MTEAKKVVIVTGSRALSDHHLVWNALNTRLRTYGPFTLRHGACPTGGDHFAHEWWVLVGQHAGCDEERYYADWDRLGKAAGPIRNAEMVDAGADELIAFFEAGQPNVGTTDCVTKGIAAGITVATWGLGEG